MKAILVLFDSLQKNFLSPYGNKWVKTPNFKRLAEKSVTFDNCYVGSMPCIPARRELHTGRYNFLHRSWGPLEPFDDSMPELLSQNRIHSHLATDHYHYWEDGGATYHNRYSTYEFVRGQEGDTWKGEIQDPEVPPHLGAMNRQDLINRKYIRAEEETSQAQTFDNGIEFINTNAGEDNWLLQIECFDPHPPYFVPEKYLDMYEDEYDGKWFDWPDYKKVKEEQRGEPMEHVRNRYAALVSQCDHSLGRVLDAVDQHELWDDTMIIVTTDHGFLLGEHDWWGFTQQPFYNIAANKPMIIYDPRCVRAGERNNELVQMHDLPATLLEYFGMEIPEDMPGIPLGETLASDTHVRDAAIYGIFGRAVNCTDGRYVYMRAPVESNNPLYEYTLMPTHLRSLFSRDEMLTAELADPFSFTKGMKILRTEGVSIIGGPYPFGNMLFDLESDPEQKAPIDDPEIEKMMIKKMIACMKENDAPAEQFERLGITEYI